MTTWKKPPELVVLSGGNPQVPKGDGEAPVRYFIDNMPGWQRQIGEDLDALICQAVPAVKKTVRWNSPFYSAGQGWFLNMHCFANFVKVTFFQGSKLRPLPPVEFKDPDARGINITEGGFDQKQMLDWVQQAAALPGWIVE